MVGAVLDNVSLVRQTTAAMVYEADATLKQGDVVVVEFDRVLADLGQEFIARGTLSSADTVLARALPSATRADADFSLGSLIVEFVVATTSGVTATLLADALRQRIKGSNAASDDVKVNELPQPPATPAPPRYRVTLDDADSPGPPPSSGDE